MKRASLPALAAGIVALLLSTIGAAPTAVPSLTEVRAREFQVTMLDGAAVPLNTLLGQGKPLVVEFWATWCSPCRKTLPHLLAIQRAHRGDVIVLGLTVEDPEKHLDRVREFAGQHGIDYPVAFAPREIFEFMNRRTSVAVPKIFVFDGAGNAVTYIQSYSPLTGHRLKSAVRKALSSHG